MGGLGAQSTPLLVAGPGGKREKVRERKRELANERPPGAKKQNTKEGGVKKRESS